MSSIAKKIIIPITITLIFVFLLLVLLVTSNTTRAISGIYGDNIEIILDQIESNIESLDTKLIDIESLKRKYKREKLSSLVDSAISIISNQYNEYQKGTISEKLAKERAISTLRTLFYDDNGYFWMDDTSYNLILHPINPHNEGKNRKKLKDKKGTFLVRELVDNSIKDGEAYVKFYFPKPGESKSSEKLGHTKLFKPWGWVIGTGFYMDEIEDEIEDIRIRDLNNFNTILQSRKNEAGYPLIYRRDKTLISSPDRSKLLKKVELLDSVTNDDIIEQLFKIKDGKYSYNSRGENGEIVKRTAYIRYYREHDWIIVYDIDNSYISSSTNRLRNIIIVTSIIAMLICIALLCIISFRVTNNIKSVTNKVYNISEGDGDLTHEIDFESRDETGQLAKYFNRFIINLRNIIINIKKIGEKSSSIGETLASNSEEVSATVEEISATMRSISDKTVKLTGEVDKSNDHIKEIRRRIDVLNRCTENESTYVSESTAAVNQMVSSINSLSKISSDKNSAINDLVTVAKAGERDMDLTVQAIEQIESSAGSMINMINVITDVSDRINLLAMNAAIEAAHAGEAGKGFAVVADEIRKLAAVTAQSTGEMTTTLGGISQSISDAAKLSETTGQTIKSITLEVVDVSSSLTEMINSFTEISTGTVQITDALSQLVKSSKEVSDSSLLIDESTKHIQGSLENVSQLSEQNSRGVFEINEGINEISIALEDLSKLSNLNAENISNLNVIVNRFKT